MRRSFSPWTWFSRTFRVWQILCRLTRLLLLAQHAQGNWNHVYSLLRTLSMKQVFDNITYETIASPTSATRMWRLCSNWLCRTSPGGWGIQLHCRYYRSPWCRYQNNPYMHQHLSRRICSHILPALILRKWITLGDHIQLWHPLC